MTAAPAVLTAAAVTADKTSFLEALAPESRVKKVIGIVSGKGGVGKSLVTSLMAVSANRRGETYRCAGCGYHRPVNPHGVWSSRRETGSDA